MHTHICTHKHKQAHMYRHMHLNAYAVINGHIQTQKQTFIQTWKSTQIHTHIYMHKKEWTLVHRQTYPYYKQSDTNRKIYVHKYTYKHTCI